MIINYSVKKRLFCERRDDIFDDNFNVLPKFGEILQVPEHVNVQQ